MAVGQGALTAAWDVAALDAAEARLEVRAVSRCFEHGQLLREVLSLDAVLAAAGAGISTGAQVALLLQVSEAAAQDLLTEARLLVSLPGALEALDCGLLTVPQSGVLRRAVAELPQPVRLAVWARLQARLLAAFDCGAVLPPARLVGLLARWVVEADPHGAEQRRRAAEADGDVTYRRRDDGLGDLFATGIPGPLLQAVLCRLRERSRAFGAQDDRTAGKRRLDALVALLLGHDALPLDDEHSCDRDGARAASCGCRPGTPVPCGADVTVLVPLGAARGTTDELAELVGHGPLHPDQLRALLLNAPVLRAVTVDVDGIPVAVADRTLRPPRGDLPGLLRALRSMAAAPPGPPRPRHSLGHPDSRAGAHPPSTPGPYRLPRRLRRLLQVRAPYCEWPGCGVRAQRCDLDHDVAWPDGATCACQCGPLCRRHHRIEQLLMTKTRDTASAVRWTDPSGRTWTSPSPHTPPARPVRAVRALRPDEPHHLSPDELTELLAADDDDPVRFELRTPDHDPDEPDTDRLAALLSCDTGWGLALDDPYRWTT